MTTPTASTAPAVAQPLLQAAMGGATPPSLQAQAGAETLAPTPQQGGSGVAPAAAPRAGHPATAASTARSATGAANAPASVAAVESNPALGPVKAAAAAFDGDRASSDADSDDTAKTDDKFDTASATVAGTQVDLLFASLTAAPSTAIAADATPLADAATAADLGAQIGARADAGDSRFQLKLNPIGLGEVTVDVRIGADRQLSAALSFDQPEAAAAVGAHTDELQKALEQAGFTLSAGGLAIAVHHPQTVAVTPVQASAATSGQGALSASSQDGQGGSAFGGSRQPTAQAGAAARAFAANDDLQTPAAPSARDPGARSRLDIRI